MSHRLHVAKAPDSSSRDEPQSASGPLDPLELLRVKDAIEEAPLMAQQVKNSFKEPSQVGKRNPLIAGLCRVLPESLADRFSVMVRVISARRRAKRRI